MFHVEHDKSGIKKPAGVTGRHMDYALLLEQGNVGHFQEQALKARQ